MLLSHNRISTIAQNYNSKGHLLNWYGKEDNIPLVRPGIWEICRGVVQLSKIDIQGNEVMLGWAVADTAFSVSLASLQVYQAKALCDTYLRYFSLADLYSSPRLSLQLWKQMNRRLQQTETLLAISGIRRIEERLQQLLSLLKQELGQPVDLGTRLCIRLTHQYLANTIGSSRVTITRLLGDFQRRGWIVVDQDRHLIIPHASCL